MAEAKLAGVLEYIKTNFPNFTEHGIQHSLRIIEYIEKILTNRAKEKMSNVEIFKREYK
ncbi:MAG: hypothetical protein Q4F29_04590 [Lachnospiraceae bacterium]|nr:hypothetical protein [Lachnospiraceae bacterium]